MKKWRKTEENEENGKIKKLWKKVFNSDPPKIKNELKDKDKVINSLKESLGKTWPNSQISTYTLDQKDKEIIKRLAINKFKELDHFWSSSKSFETIDCTILNKLNPNG